MFNRISKSIRKCLNSPRRTLLLAFTAGYLFHWMSPGLPQALALTEDLGDAPREGKVEVLFRQFLEIEQDTFRDGPFSIRKGWPYTFYSRYTSTFSTYFHEQAREERYTVFAEELQDLEEHEKIARVIEEIDRNCSNRISQRQLDALTADLRKALIERTAALDLLRFTSRTYTNELMSDILERNRLELHDWCVVLDDFDGRESIPGTATDLFMSRVIALAEQIDQ
tara:strand:- start:349 stop:1023 length:675 start_codon:yes stop_codon:yes gene_type:complete